MILWWSSLGSVWTRLIRLALSAMNFLSWPRCSQRSDIAFWTRSDALWVSSGGNKDASDVTVPLFCVCSSMLIPMLKEELQFSHRVQKSRVREWWKERVVLPNRTARSNPLQAGPFSSGPIMRVYNRPRPDFLTFEMWNINIINHNPN